MSKVARRELVRSAVSRNKGLVALVAVGVVLLAAVIAFFHALWERQNSSLTSVREDALWATYQTDREVGKLIQALQNLVGGRPTGSIAEVSRRFDILYSRHEVMEEADFPGKFRSDRRLQVLTERLSAQLHAMLPRFDRFAAEKAGEPAEIEAALAQAMALRGATEELLAATNHVQLALQVDEREETTNIYAWLAGTVVALMLAVGAVIIIIWRQMKQLEISRFRLQRASEDLARSVVEAEAGNKAKSAFLATMSHEIRTPLNGIIGTAELMSTGRLDSEQVEQLAVIRQCSDALIALINDILDFSKLESGAIDLERRPVELAEVIDGVVEMLSPRAEAKGLDLVASYPLLTIETDPTRLRQVLINLVGNAVKFTDFGGVVVRAREVIDLEGGRRLRVEVEDTGVGISTAAIARLFTEFSQADASIGRRFGGTGLGLAISKRIVEAMAGRIGVESTEGKGTVFWIDVPVGRVEATGPSELPGRTLKTRIGTTVPMVCASIARDLHRLGGDVLADWQRSPAPDVVVVDLATWEKRQAGDDPIDPLAAVVFGFGARALAGRVSAVVEGAMTTRRLARVLTHRLQGTVPSSSFDTGRARTLDKRFSGHVLVVEDNPVNRKVAVGILARLGLTTETVVDGLQAVERLAKGGIDLVLMDMQMPVMDGLEATRRIRQDGGPAAAVPIVGLTANAFASDRAACFEAGMNDFVMKPVTRDRLQAALAVHLPEAAEEEAAAPSGGAAAASVGATSGAANPVLDPVHRHHLEEMIGAEGLAELTEVFVTDSAALLEALSRAYEAGDRDGVRTVLHTLTGAAANVGCVGVVAAIAAIREAGGLECPDLVGRLGAALLTARTALEGGEAPARDGRAA